jgi:hypothetical protein
MRNLIIGISPGILRFNSQFEDKLGSECNTHGKDDKHNDGWKQGELKPPKRARSDRKII